jgi:hypothetical protein
MRALLFLVVSIVLVFAYYAGQGSRETAASPEQTARREVKEKFKLRKFNLIKSDFGTLTGTFSFQNDSDFDVKDVKVICEHDASSGTTIDRNTRTIYELFKARSTRTIDNFSMGFVHSQAARSGCAIVDFVVAARRPATSPAPVKKPKSAPAATATN